MNLESVERLANAILYEGYMLYPYRPSSVKNRRRFNFGVLVPPAYSAIQSGSETSAMRTECLVRGRSQTTVDVRVRFLQVMPGSWQEAVEREVSLLGCRLGDLVSQPRAAELLAGESACPTIEGTLTLSARRLGDGLFLLSAHVMNRTSLDSAEQLSRDEVLPYSLVAAHTILTVREGEFVSLTDPPDAFRDAASQCQNIGVWPVLVGEPDARDAMLSSPIILYDYAQVAPESPGDLFDGAEIDEILTLRIMTLTDEEKQEVRNGDARARHILERTEMLPDEHLMKLHGALRGLRPVEESK
jgi:hydrogenase maturation protease